MRQLSYEDPNYWSQRADNEGVATLGWSPRVNSFYYSIKENILEAELESVSDQGSVLEVGCGVGRIGRFIHETRPDVHLIGIDFSEHMLSRAAYTGAYTALLQANATDLPFPSSYFDLVIVMDVLFHIVTPRKKGRAWLEFSRVAKQDSRVFAYETAHEITSLAVIHDIISRLPTRHFNRAIRDRITIWLTQLCDLG